MAQGDSGKLPLFAADSGILVAEDWDFVKPLSDQWERRPSARSLRGAGRRAIAEERTADAERLLNKAIQLSPDRATYNLLASIYKKANDEAKWLATLEGFLKEPDPGLGHAQTRVEIANYFMAKKDFKKAQPYAEAAAGTVGFFGMLCAGRCVGPRAMGGSRELFSPFVRALQNSYSYWYYWCVHTGRGDQKAAQELVEKFFSAMGAPRRPTTCSRPA